jgi:hypothetical protein
VQQHQQHTNPAGLMVFGHPLMLLMQLAKLDSNPWWSVSQLHGRRNH